MSYTQVVSGDGRRIDLTVTVCKKGVSWVLIVDPESGAVEDVIPCVDSFAGLVYTPYQLLDCLRMDESLTVSALVTAIDEDMRACHNSYIRSACSDKPLLVSCIDRYSSLEGYSSLVTRTSVFLVFPFLHASTLQCPDIEYLLDLLKRTPITVLAKFGLLDDSVSVSIETPSTLPCSRLVEYPVYTKGVSIADYLALSENILSSRLALRRAFVLEIARIGALIEFDAVDFSSVILAVRIKSHDRFSVCVAEVRLTHAFPDVMPLASAYDLLTNLSTPIESSVFSKVKSEEPERIAKEYYETMCKQIYRLAFG